MRSIVMLALVGAATCSMLFGPPPAIGAQSPRLQTRSECQCTCSYTDAQGKAEQGTIAFSPPAGNNCNVALDPPVPCKDSAGQVHPGMRVTGCMLLGGIAPPVASTNQLPAARQ